MDRLIDWALFLLTIRTDVGQVLQLLVTVSTSVLWTLVEYYCG